MSDRTKGPRTLGKYDEVNLRSDRDQLATIDHCLIFFFSSRRRHTRYIGDWSSDVCSSDLRLLHFCLRLFALVLRQIIEGGNALARGTRSFPAAKRLITGPGAGRGPLRTINVGDSRLDVVEEVGCIFVIAVATGSQSEPGIIGQPYGLSAIAHPTKHGDRHEHFLGKQRMRGWRFSQSWRNKIAVRQFTFGQTFAAGQNARAVFSKFFTVTLVVFKRAGRGHWPEPVFLQRRIANRNRRDFFLEPFDQRIRDFVINVDSRYRRALLSA